MEERSTRSFVINEVRVIRVNYGEFQLCVEMLHSDSLLVSHRLKIQPAQTVFPGY